MASFLDNNDVHHPPRWLLCLLCYCLREGTHNHMAWARPLQRASFSGDDFAFSIVACIRFGRGDGLPNQRRWSDKDIFIFYTNGFDIGYLVIVFCRYIDDFPIIELKAEGRKATTQRQGKWQRQGTNCYNLPRDSIPVSPRPSRASLPAVRGDQASHRLRQEPRYLESRTWNGCRC